MTSKAPRLAEASYSRALEIERRHKSRRFDLEAVHDQILRHRRKRRIVGFLARHYAEITDAGSARREPARPNGQRVRTKPSLPTARALTGRRVPENRRDWRLAD